MTLLDYSVKILQFAIDTAVSVIQLLKTKFNLAKVQVVYGLDQVLAIVVCW